MGVYKPISNWTEKINILQKQKQLKSTQKSTRWVQSIPFACVANAAYSVIGHFFQFSPFGQNRKIINIGTLYI